MHYYELTTTVFLKQSLLLKETAEKQSALLKAAMLKSETLKALHAEKGVKLYGYDYLYPRAEAKKYHENRAYYFKIRTPVKETATAFLKVLSHAEDAVFKVVGCQMKKKRYYPKTELYTATPAVCTLGRRYWNADDGMDVIEEKIEKNLVTKYTAFYGEVPERTSDFVQYLEKKTRVPFVMRYKNGHVVGEKFLIGFNTDELSLKMSFLAYTTSILEKSSSLGTGFCV